MADTGTKMKASKAKELAKRDDVGLKRFWPDVQDKEIWTSKHGGFLQAPRTLTLILTLMDDMAGKGNPVSRTYLTLWARNMGSGAVQLGDEKLAALESGFCSERRTTVWRQRMRKLVELGFVRPLQRDREDFSRVLILNPHNVVRRFWEQCDDHKRRRLEAIYSGIQSRAHDRGCKDFFQELPTT